MSQQNLQSCLPRTFSASQVLPFGPVIEYPHEGAFLSEDPEEIIKSGRSHQIPIIMGYNSMEGILFGILRKRTGVTSLPSSTKYDVPYDLNIAKDSKLVGEVVEKINEFYYKDSDVSESSDIGTKYMLFGDILFVHGIQKTARLLKLHGNSPVYMYRMSLDSILNLIKKVCVTNYLKTLAFTFLLTKFPSCSVKRIFWGLVNKLSANDIEGAAHADDLLYLFKTGLSPNILKGSKEDGYIQKFVKPWTNFAKYGNPTPEEDGVLDNVLWRPIVSENMENIFDINETITVTGNLERERMEFWDDLYRTHANI